MRPKLSLAGQFLALQLAIVAAVVVVVAGVSIAQQNAAFQRTEGARLRSVAETVAATRTVQNLEDSDAREALPGIAETARGFGGQSYVLIADADGVLLTGPDTGDRIRLGDSQVLSGRSWVGTVETAELIAEVLRAAGADLSAAECAEQAGLSRVSARRYLEHFVDTGRAQVALKYGTAGRPERRYRWGAVSRS
ncbi:MAG: hypothetical protein ACRDT6_20970 [Micromonosporaceae bacterium]